MGGKKPVDLADLVGKVKASSHRMTNEEVAWWHSFVAKQREEREMWKNLTQAQMEEMAKQNWLLTQLKKFNAKDFNKREPETEDQRRQREELERLSKKENHFPPVGIQLFQIIFYEGNGEL